MSTPNRPSISSDLTFAEKQQNDVKPMSKAEEGVLAGHEVKVAGEREAIVDAVWGEIGEDGPNYRNLGWIRAAVLETKTQIGLGVLGLPAVLDTLGFVPGIIVILAIAVIITWSDLVIGQFKKKHPECYTVADVGYIWFGPVGREIWGFLYWLLLTAIAASGMLSFSIALNAVSDHGACTVVFVLVGAVITGLVSCIQTLDRISWIGWVGVFSITSAVITLAVAVGVTDRPSAAPATGPIDLNVQTVAHPSFVEAINAVSVVVFAYAGAPNFMNIIGEMRNQRDYAKSVWACQTFVTCVYLVIGSIVYHCVGQYIASPALGSAGILMKKVCYGIAMPGLIVGCMINVHMPAKYVFVRILHNSRHLARNTPIHYAVWFGCVIFNCTISFIIAEAIPIFSDLLSLIGALLGTFLCIQTEGFMWLYDNWHSTRTKTWWALVTMNITFIVLGMFAMVAGTYGAAIVIHKDLTSGNKTSPFSCADNSGS